MATATKIGVLLTELTTGTVEERLARCADFRPPVYFHGERDEHFHPFVSEIIDLELRSRFRDIPEATILDNSPYHDGLTLGHLIVAAYRPLLNGQWLRSVRIERDEDGWRVASYEGVPHAVGYVAELQPTLRLVAWAVEYAIITARLRDCLRRVASGLTDDESVEMAGKIRGLNRHVQQTMGFGCGDTVYQVQ